MITNEALACFRHCVQEAGEREHCGLFTGGRFGELAGYWPVPNSIFDAWGRFQLEPSAFVEVVMRAASRGHQVTGIAHSQPDSRVPSLRDMEGHRHWRTIPLLIGHRLDDRVRVAVWEWEEDTYIRRWFEVK